MTVFEYKGNGPKTVRWLHCRPTTYSSKMYLHLQSRSRFNDLHLSTALHDWDMNEEIQLTTTTDQYYQECRGFVDDTRSDQYLAQWHYARISRRSLPSTEASLHFPPNAKEPEIQPNLWLMVNPSLACPIKYPNSYPKAPTPPKLTTMPRSTTAGPEQGLHPVILPEETCLNESVHDTSLSSEYQLTDEDDASSVDVPVCRKVKGARRGRAPKAPTRKLGLTQNRRLQRALQDSMNLKSGAWPRPPVNYCILIAMALSSSRTGSLNVQQIYNFTREHFPFFITAPDGWKNTIRHNLCFSNSFKKTPQQVSGDGKRKSCLWHLTLDGRQRLRDEIHTLTGDSFRMLKRSMNYPDMIKALFEL
ncbi:forkhead box protein R1 isoform X1 [Triplophysa dalaica]|uniref:forkhead box protein R1 isoform X1 n=1 Tax=Triplophysa dalaica TaxID=1582913 RepID=UPI0024DFF825|nr:forkhead box protein R1 isoform X1 [Triplophysa dalaica]